jgi:carbonic anhydrase
MPKTWDPSSLEPDAALHRLKAGNQRFIDGTGTQRGGFDAEKMAAAQRPFAIVLGCSDSRTPVEILFDEGFGDLFVVRIAGNIVAPSVVGSIEFAAAQFGSRLVVVMGHTRCGAVGATIASIESGQGPESRNIRSITDRIAPHVEELVQPGNAEQVLRHAVRANVRASADHLRHGSRILEELVESGHLAVVGAEYEIETGKVNFFHGADLAPPEGSPSRPAHAAPKKPV